MIEHLLVCPECGGSGEVFDRQSRTKVDCSLCNGEKHITLRGLVDRSNYPAMLFGELMHALQMEFDQLTTKTPGVAIEDDIPF